MSLLSMPQELFDEIVSYLGVEDIMALRLSSRECNMRLDSKQTLKSGYLSTFDPPLHRCPDWQGEFKRRGQLLEALDKMRTTDVAVNWDLLLYMHSENRERNFRYLNAVMQSVTQRCRGLITYQDCRNPSVVSRIFMLYINVSLPCLDPVVIGRLLHRESWPTTNNPSFDNSPITWERAYAIVYHHRCSGNGPVLKTWLPNWRVLGPDWSSLIPGTWFGTLAHVTPLALLWNYPMLTCECSPDTSIWRLTLVRKFEGNHRRSPPDNIRSFDGILGIENPTGCKKRVFAQVVARVTFHPHAQCLNWHLAIGNFQKHGFTKTVYANGVQPIVGRVVMAGTRDPFPKEISTGHYHTFAFWPEEQC